MSADDPLPTALTRAECLALLASAPVGRMAYEAEARSPVQPVAYHLDDESIVIYTASNSALISDDHTDVALAISDPNPAQSTKWTVIVSGPASLITDPADLAYLARLPLKVLPLDSPAPDGTGTYVRIACARLTGDQTLSRPSMTATGPAVRKAEGPLLNGHMGPGQPHPALSEQVNTVIGLLFHAGLDLASIRQASDADIRTQAQSAATTLDGAIRALRLLVMTLPITDPYLAR